MLGETVDNDRLRMVWEYVVDFERQLLLRKIAEEGIEAVQKDPKFEIYFPKQALKIKLAEKEALINEKDAEIDALKAKLKENGIDY